MQRELEPEVSRHIWLENGTFTCVYVGFFWLLVLLSGVLNLFGMELSRRGRTISTRDLAILALVISAWGGLHLTRRLWRARHLARRGIEVRGTVRYVGGIRHSPWERLVFTYTCDQRAYKRSNWGDMSEHRIGEPLKIVIDPHAPKRCLLRTLVFPPDYEAAPLPHLGDFAAAQNGTKTGRP